MHRTAKHTPAQTQRCVGFRTPTSGAVAYLAQTCPVPESSWNVTGQPTVFTWLMGNSVKQRRCHSFWSSVLRNLDSNKKNNKFFQFLFFCWLPGFPIFLQCSNTGVIVRVHLATQELDMGMVQETHPSYDLYQTFFSTSDTGHGGAARDRTYVIGSHGDRTSCKVDPEEVKDIISKRMKGKVRTVPSDYFMAQLVEVELEAQQLACKRKVEYKEGCRDFRYLLTEREKRALQSYESSYPREFGEEAHLNPNLVVFLGDNGSTWKTWSAKSNQISTFRKKSKTGLYWSPHLQRFMVARQKLAALAWPVTGTMAKAMCCGQIPSQDIHRAADLAGNAMHFTTVAVAQLLALACFRPLD